MKAEWKDPKKELPAIPDGQGSVCVMVTPGDGMAEYPMKAWFNSSGNAFWLASCGSKAIVDGWDYYPEHLNT